jgi:DNA-directed RNA polymerase subunit RPC12/RpoP
MKRPGWLTRLRPRRQPCPECGAKVQETYCEVCGYDLILKTRADATLHKPV